LKNINEILGSQEYPRLRFGIGNQFPKGRQVDYVLGKWTDEEMQKLPDLIKHCVESIEAFTNIGLEKTMNFYNIK
jgi:PTH1 family peptidyl-tRNA hydrolase